MRADEPTYDFDIPEQRADDALILLGEQADATVLFQYDMATQHDANRLQGEFTLPEAVDILLADSGLKAEFGERGHLYISVEETEREGDDMNVKKKAGFFAALAAAFTGANGQEVAESNQKGEETPTLEEIVVIGTHFRGVLPESSPVYIYDREDILLSGAATAQDFVQTIPQNFGGGSNVDNGFSLPNDNNTQFNDGFGASVNLRGLGSGSTLVLLNGHRIAPSSGIGDFADISMIPASAIERIEVLADGASSIYGADAVAGVVNFVLRKDFEGVEASIRYGTVTDGGLDEYRASVAGGSSWDTGNGIFIYEYYKQEELRASERTFSQGAPLPFNLLPNQRRHSVLSSVSQKLAENFEINAELLYSRREPSSQFTDSAMQVLSSNSQSDYGTIAAGASWQFREEWFLDFSGTYSDISEDLTLSGDVADEQEIDSNIWTADIKATGDLLELPAGAIKLAIGGHVRSESFTNFDVDDLEVEREADRDVYAVFAEVLIPIVDSGNSVPGVERLEINLSGRYEDFSDFGSTSNPKVGVLYSPFESLRFRGSYGSSFKPPPLGRVGASDLGASAVPSSLFNDIFGLTPGDPSIADVVMITVFGTDKNLDAETSKAFTVGANYDRQWQAHGLSVSVTYFDVDFEDRLGSTPIPENRVVFDAPNIAFNNPELFPEGTVLFFPSESEITEVLDSLDRIGVFPGLDPMDAGIINLAAVVRNLSSTFVTGFDFAILYTYDSGLGDLSLGVEGMYLTDFQQQAAETTPVIEQVSTLYNPVDLKLRGRIGYRRGGFSANAFVNHTDSYRVDNLAESAEIDSWTTVDVNLAYETQQRFGDSVLNDVSIRLSVINALDEDPPVTPGAPTFGIFGFDPANASPLNRFIALEISKRF